MARKFTVNASEKIQAARTPSWIRAAKNEEAVDPRIEQLEELLDKVEDDFDFTIAGIDRLGREGMLDEALKLLGTLSDTFNSAIGIIGGDFESNASIDAYNTGFDGLEDVGAASEYYPDEIEEPEYTEDYDEDYIEDDFDDGEI